MFTTVNTPGISKKVLSKMNKDLDYEMKGVDKNSSDYTDKLKLAMDRILKKYK